MANSKHGKIITVGTSIAVILLGILYIVFCAHLYFTGGNRPYSAERVGKYLVILALPSFITVAFAVTGIIYALISGVKDDELAGRTQCEMLHSLSKRADTNALPENIKKDVLKEREKRLNISWISYDISLIFTLTAIVLLCTVPVFTVENLNGDVMLAILLVLPAMVCAMSVHVPKAYMLEKSAEREIALIKEAIKGGMKIRKPEGERISNREKQFVLGVRIAITAVAVVFIILGVANGGMKDVLQKAVKICTECIGLG